MSYPSDIITTLSLRISASSIAWVVSSMDLFYFICFISSQTYYLDLGSMPVDGSSRNITEGSPIVEITRESLLFIPPEKEEE